MARVKSDWTRARTEASLSARLCFIVQYFFFWSWCASQGSLVLLLSAARGGGCEGAMTVWGRRARMHIDDLDSSCSLDHVDEGAGGGRCTIGGAIARDTGAAGG